ncbi:MAG: glycosyltransferase [Proteobacteria bacterium]|nr:glycosyltransferase [Pseudomonadota bacterium]
MSLLANGLAARGHEIFLITLASAEHDFYPLDQRVQRVGLEVTGNSAGMLGAVRANTRRVKVLRGSLRATSADTLLAFATHTNILAVVAAAGLRMRVVISERIDPAAHSEGPLWDALRLLAYQAADAVVVQTEKIGAWFRARLWRPGRVVVIPNLVLGAPRTTEDSAPLPAPFVLAAGRLVPQKGFDLLVRGFALAGEPDLHLVIAGEGPERPRLARLAAELGIAGRVHLLGNVRDLASLMQHARIFVLSSRYEGFPNVLLEALACGVPAIATDIDGVGEILLGGVCGVLVPAEDAPALGRAIARLTRDQPRREQLAAAGRAALRRYAPEPVLESWESVLGSER